MKLIWNSKIRWGKEKSEKLAGGYKLKSFFLFYLINFCLVFSQQMSVGGLWIRFSVKLRFCLNTIEGGEKRGEIGLNKIFEFFETCLKDFSLIL